MVIAKSRTVDKISAGGGEVLQSGLGDVTSVAFKLTRALPYTGKHDATMAYL